MESLNQWIRSVIPEGKRRLALQYTTTNTVVPALASTFIMQPLPTRVGSIL